MDFDLHYRTDAAGRTTIELLGALDLATRNMVLHTTRDAITQTEHGAVVLDVSGVTFIDSTGLAALIELYRFGTEHGVEVILRDPSPRVRQVLDLTAVAGYLTVESTTEPTASASP
jgi:anti-anti-sigma factor